MAKNLTFRNLDETFEMVSCTVLSLMVLVILVGVVLLSVKMLMLL